MTIDRDLQTNALIIATSKGNVPLQVVRWSGARQAVTSSASSKVIPLPAGLEGMEISAVEDVYINFGVDDTIVASSTIASDGSRFFLAGTQVIPVPLDPATGIPYTHMAVIRKSTDGIFQLESGGANVSFPALPAPPGDPDFASVVLLLDFAGVDDATDITDLSNSAHVDTFSGGAKVSTEIQMLESNSLEIPAVSTSHVSFPDSADWDFGTDDFTIECLFSVPDISLTHTFISANKTGNLGWYFRWHSSGVFQFIHVTTSLKLEAASLSNDTVFHIAFSRAGTSSKLFLDGVQLGTPDIASIDVQASGDPLLLGAQRPNNSQLLGHMGGVRITKGVARYTENFTPPTEFYPTS